MIQVVFGFLWFLAIFMGIIFLGPIIIGSIVDTHRPVSAVGETAAETFVQNYGVLIFIISFIVTAFGSVLGLLPGTKSKYV
jgi:hypothetical protein